MVAIPTRCAGSAALRVGRCRLPRCRADRCPAGLVVMCLCGGVCLVVIGRTVAGRGGWRVILGLGDGMWGRGCGGLGCVGSWRRALAITLLVGAVLCALVRPGSAGASGSV